MNPEGWISGGLRRTSGESKRSTDVNLSDETEYNVAWNCEHFWDLMLKVSRQPFPVKIYDRPKTTRECGMF